MKINRITMQHILNARGINASDLRKDGISSVTLAKIAKGDEVKASTVLKIAAALNVEAEILVETNPFLSFLMDRCETAALKI